MVLGAVVRDVLSPRPRPSRQVSVLFTRSVPWYCVGGRCGADSEGDAYSLARDGVSEGYMYRLSGGRIRFLCRVGGRRDEF